MTLFADRTSPRISAGWPEALAAVLAAPHRVRVHFQPVVDLRHGEVRGYEALARFEGDEPAADWFAAAVSEGCSGALEAHVLEAALVQRPLLAGGRTIAVNVSPAALLCDEVEAVLAAHPRLDSLVVEVTGQGPAVDCAALEARLADLGHRGAELAADDAEQLDPALLRAVAPSQIKVHHTRLEEGRALADALGATLVAKGVEDDEDLERLAQAGVRYVQGFGLGVPVPVPGELDVAVAAGLRGLAVAESGPLDLGALIDPATDADAAALSLPAATSPADAARAAMARPAEQRFAPLVAVGPSGERLGAVPVDRLVTALIS